MDKETMYWLFSTAPQAVGTLVGIIFTGMLFVATSINKQKALIQEENEASAELDKISDAIYKNMKVVAWMSGVAIIYDLFMIYKTPMMARASGEICCFFFWLKLIFAGLNIGVIVVIFYYALDVVNPRFVNRIKDNLKRSR